MSNLSPQWKIGISSIVTMKSLTQSQSQKWWCMPGISALGRLRQEDCKFQASLSYMKPYPKKERKERKGRRGRRLGEKVKGKKGEREREGERGKRKRGKERARKGMEGKGSSKVLAMAHTEKNLPFFIFLCGTWNVRCKGKLLL
jgi:hypothetical protein